MITDSVRTFHPRQTPPIGRTRRWRGELTIDRIYLLFTSFEDTVGALPEASRLARALGSRLSVLHLRPVAFGEPLEQACGLSPVQTDEFRKRLEAEHCEAEARVCLCRDARAALSRLFQEPSLVVMGCHQRWWPTTAAKWRRTLEADGHLVVLVDAEAHA